jgi:hypothetical protein
MKGKGPNNLELFRCMLIKHIAEMQDRSMAVIDGLIAATGIRYNFTIVTRNIEDIEVSGVTLLNPWDWSCRMTLISFRCLCLTNSLCVTLAICDVCEAKFPELIRVVKTILVEMQ